MAYVMDGVETKAVPTYLETGEDGRVITYPWHRWLDGRVWKLKKGEDFLCSMKSFQSILSNQRGRRMVDIRTRKLDEETYLIQRVGRKYV